MSRSIRKETSSFAFGMVGRFGGSSAGFVVAALNAASATSREVVVFVFCRQTFYVLSLGSTFLKRKLTRRRQAACPLCANRGLMHRDMRPAIRGPMSIQSVPARSGTKTIDCENSSRVNRRARVMALQ